MKNLLTMASGDVFSDWSKRFQRVLCSRQRAVENTSYVPLESQADRYEDVPVRKKLQWNGCGLRIEKINVLDKTAALNYLVTRALGRSYSLYSGKYIRCGYYHWLAVAQHCQQNGQDFSVIMNTLWPDGRTVLEMLVASKDHASLHLVHKLLPRGLQKGGIYLSHSFNETTDQTVFQLFVFKHGGYAGSDTSATFYGNTDHGFPTGYGVFKWPGGHTYVGDWSGFGSFYKEGFRLTATFHDSSCDGLNFEYEPEMWKALGDPVPVDFTVPSPICPGAKAPA